VEGLWAAITLACELAIGRLVFGYSWARIATEYDPARGGVMTFGLLFFTASRLIVSGVHRRRPAWGTTLTPST
jgi:hypothetical protein